MSDSKAKGRIIPPHGGASSARPKPSRQPTIVDQPPPVARRDRPGIWELVIEDMRDRDAVGRERYGTPLQAGNGRNALVDAYQEALDLAVYLRQEIEERKQADGVREPGRWYFDDPPAQWSMASAIHDDGVPLRWRIGIAEDGEFTVFGDLELLTGIDVTPFWSLLDAKAWCESQEAEFAQLEKVSG